NWVPTAADAGSTYAIAIAFCSVGANVPLHTRPTGRSPASSAAPSRASRLPVSSRPTRTGNALSPRRFSSAARPRQSPLSILTAQARPRLERVDLLRQFVAVQRHGRLQPQRVARPEAARFGAALDQLLPERDRIRGADHQLHAGLAGVPGAAEDALLAQAARR